MEQKFCVQCGASLMESARFCVECGHPVEAPPAAATGGFRMDRWAPAVVAVAVFAITGMAVWAGTRSAPDVRPIPGRGASAGEMPRDHPPVALPDDVRAKIDEIVTAARENPEDVDAWVTAARVQYRVGQIDPSYLEAAEASYRHVLELDEGNREAIRGLGNVAYDQNDPEKAIEQYERYLELEPDDPSVITDMGTMHLAAGKTEQAMALYRKALEVEPKFFQAQFNMAIAQRGAGDTEEALRSLEKAREMAPDESARKQVGQIIARVRDGDGAGAGAGGGGAGAGAGDAKLPDGHPPMEGASSGLPEGHPPIEAGADRPAMPEGHPPIEAGADRPAMPEGHPPIGDGGRGGLPEGHPPLDQAGPGTAAPDGAEDVAGSGFRESVEEIFRRHPIVGSRLDRVDWTDDRKARVVLREFPMDSMPPFAREKFVGRIRSGIESAKEAAGLSEVVRVDLVDQASGRVMETVQQ